MAAQAQEIPCCAASKPSAAGSVRLKRGSPGNKVRLEAVREFAAWADGRWAVLYSIFNLAASCDPEEQLVSIGAFLAHLRHKGFKGDALNLLRIMRDLHPVSGSDGGVRLSQMLRLEDLCIAAVAHEKTPEDPPHARLIDFFRQKRGSVLRGWRLDLDTLEKGWVSRADFAQACRKLDFGKDAKLFWSSLRPDGSSAPLRFRELDPVEADNLDDFADWMASQSGGSMDEAWTLIDPSHRTSVSFEDFERALSRLGFTGNASQLFRGLDTRGWGHLMRKDLEYLKLSAQAPADAHGVARGPSSPQPRKTSLRNEPPLSSSGRLPTQAQQAKPAATSPLGMGIAADAARSLSPQRRSSLAAPQRKSPPSQLRAEWDSSCANFEVTNSKRHPSQRQYFPVVAHEKSGSQPAAAQDRRPAAQSSAGSLRRSSSLHAGLFGPGGSPSRGTAPSSSSAALAPSSGGHEQERRTHSAPFRPRSPSLQRHLQGGGPATPRGGTPSRAPSTRRSEVSLPGPACSSTRVRPGES